MASAATTLGLPPGGSIQSSVSQARARPLSLREGCDFARYLTRCSGAQRHTGSGFVAEIAQPVAGRSRAEPAG
jgi:hypothetical protein